ncbi:MAG: Hpt domain-containing protein [Gammaproteobacteria bacterium]|nr:Hpt domain-containing protein [Gammaproteobacteria bacterium]
MTPYQDDIQAKIAAVRQSYCEALPQRLARIQTLWQLLHGDSNDQASYDEFYRLIHTMAGSAETFGFPELTQTARRIVQQLKTADPALIQNPVIAQELESLQRIIHNIGLL